MDGKRPNCWEHFACGKEGGHLGDRRSGVCPAAIERRADGVNGGRNAGRACWAIAGTLCGGRVQGGFRDKVRECLRCDFYRLVGVQEGSTYMYTTDILQLLRDETPADAGELDTQWEARPRP